MVVRLADASSLVTSPRVHNRSFRARIDVTLPARRAVVGGCGPCYRSITVVLLSSAVILFIPYLLCGLLSMEDC